MHKTTFLLLLLLAAGCGGDDDEGHGPTNPFAPSGVTPLRTSTGTSPGTMGLDHDANGFETGTLPGAPPSRNLTSGNDTCWISRFDGQANSETTDWRGDVEPETSYIVRPLMLVELNGNACGLGLGAGSTNSLGNRLIEATVSILPATHSMGQWTETTGPTPDWLRIEAIAPLTINNRLVFSENHTGANMGLRVNVNSASSARAAFITWVSDAPSSETVSIGKALIQQGGKPTAVRETDTITLNCVSGDRYPPSQIACPTEIEAGEFLYFTATIQGGNSGIAGREVPVGSNNRGRLLHLDEYGGNLYQVGNWRIAETLLGNEGSWIRGEDSTYLVWQAPANPRNGSEQIHIQPYYEQWTRRRVGKFALGYPTRNLWVPWPSTYPDSALDDSLTPLPDPADRTVDATRSFGVRVRVFKRTAPKELTADLRCVPNVAPPSGAPACSATVGNAAPEGANFVDLYAEVGVENDGTTGNRIGVPPYTYDWEVPSGVGFETEGNDGTKLAWDFTGVTTRGPYRVRLEVTDSAGAVTRASKSVFAWQQNAPVASTLPTISIGDATVAEGGTATVTVTVAGTVSDPASAEIVTRNGTAIADSDFHAIPNFPDTESLTFTAAGSKTVSVRTIDDDLPESSESFSVVLSRPVNVEITDAVGRVTITDSDVALPTPTKSAVRINDVRVTEGEAAVFTVTRGTPTTGSVQVDYRSVAESATAGSDYTTVTSNVTFSAGQTSKTVTIATTDDSVVEDRETFRVVLALSSTAGMTAELEDGEGIGVINDNDTTPPTTTPTGRNCSNADSSQTEFAGGDRYCGQLHSSLAWTNFTNPTRYSDPDTGYKPSAQEGFLLTSGTNRICAYIGTCARSWRNAMTGPETNSAGDVWEWVTIGAPVP